jgi:ketosteroid isomerase-like protein
VSASIAALSLPRATMPSMAKEPAHVVDELWARIAAHDWTRVGHLLAEDVVVDWPISAERITGWKNFVAIQMEYPEGWSIEVLRIIADADGESVVSEVEVPHEEFGEVFRAASFWTVRHGLITAGREYWSTVGAESATAPQWRAPYVTRIES